MLTLLLATILPAGQYAPPLKAGTPAPPWVAKTPEGKNLSLKLALAGKKALLVNFWFYT